MWGVAHTLPARRNLVVLFSSPVINLEHPNVPFLHFLGPQNLPTCRRKDTIQQTRACVGEDSPAENDGFSGWLGTTSATGQLSCCIHGAHGNPSYMRPHAHSHEAASRQAHPVAGDLRRAIFLYVLAYSK